MLGSGFYQTSLCKKLSTNHCDQINSAAYKLNEKPSNLLLYKQFYNSKTTFTKIHFVFLELGTNHFYLDFKHVHEKNNPIIPNTFYIQLLKKNHEYV